MTTKASQPTGKRQGRQWWTTHRLPLESGLTRMTIRRSGIREREDRGSRKRHQEQRTIPLPFNLSTSLPTFSRFLSQIRQRQSRSGWNLSGRTQVDRRSYRSLESRFNDSAVRNIEKDGEVMLPLKNSQRRRVILRRFYSGPLVHYRKRRIPRECAAAACIHSSQCSA